MRPLSRSCNTRHRTYTGTGVALFPLHRCIQRQSSVLCNARRGRYSWKEGLSEAKSALSSEDIHQSDGSLTTSAPARSANTASRKLPHDVNIGDESDDTDDLEVVTSGGEVADFQNFDEFLKLMAELRTGGEVEIFIDEDGLGEGDLGEEEEEEDEEEEGGVEEVEIFINEAELREGALGVEDELQAEVGEEEEGEDYTFVSSEEGAGEVVEDVEIYNLASGWSVEALKRTPRAEDDIIPSTSTSTGLVLDGAADDDESALRLSISPALRALPQHMLEELEKQQIEATDVNAALKPAARKKAAALRKTHKKLKIISGTATGRLLVSSQGLQTRPMMEKVRAAVFSMIHSLLGSPYRLPAGTRWLDLFAGTGAVGLEGLSRGCAEAHFVELDSWVVSNCLKPNLQACDLDSQSLVHTARVEDFLRRSLKKGKGNYAGGAFDFISMCPPYLLVCYVELFDLLNESPLIHPGTILIVEYPKKLNHLIREEVGPLVKLRDRKYGRTFVALYGPPSAKRSYQDEDDDY